MHKGTVRYENCIYKQKCRNVPFFDFFSTSEARRTTETGTLKKKGETGGEGRIKY